MPRLLTTALLALLVLAGCSQQDEDNTLVVGMELSYPPFEMTDQGNQPTGVSVDLAYALGEYLGRPVRIENTNFQGLIPALKTGKIDLILSSMTATEERAKSIDFSDPYLDTGLCLLVSINSQIQKIEDVDKPGNAVAVKRATTGHDYAAKNITQATVLALEKETSCVLEVVQGKAQAFIFDQMSTYRNWKRNPETTRPILAPFQKESWAIGIKKGNDELRQQLNAFLSEFKAKNGFEELGNRYLREEKEAFAELGYPFFF